MLNTVSFWLCCLCVSDPHTMLPSTSANAHAVEMVMEVLRYSLWCPYYSRAINKEWNNIHFHYDIVIIMCNKWFCYSLLFNLKRWRVQLISFICWYSVIPHNAIEWEHSRLHLMQMWGGNTRVFLNGSQTWMGEHLVAGKTNTRKRTLLFRKAIIMKLRTNMR